MVALLGAASDFLQKVLKPLSSVISFGGEKSYLTLDIETRTRADVADAVRGRSVAMRRGCMTKEIRGAAIMCLALAVCACTQRSQTLAPATPAVSYSPLSSLSQMSRDPLKLQEVRIIETAGQRSILFRFSQPPEEVDYFPLREPSRLVIDVKGSVESPPQAETYNTVDSLVSAVRIGSYQGHMRLVVELESDEVPQFSVDNHDTLLTTFIGEKRSSDAYATTNTEVLFVADDVDDDLESPVIQIGGGAGA